MACRGTEQAKALRAASMLSRYMGDYIRAKALANSSIELYREIGDNQGVGLALIELGATLIVEGKQEEAIELLQRVCFAPIYQRDVGNCLRPAFFGHCLVQVGRY